MGVLRMLASPEAAADTIGYDNKVLMLALEVAYA